MKKMGWLPAISGAVFCLLLVCQPALAQTCDPGLVWVPGFKTAEGDTIGGFCRSAEQKGFIWVEKRWCQILIFDFMPSRLFL